SLVGVRGIDDYRGGIEPANLLYQLFEIARGADHTIRIQPLVAATFHIQAKTAGFQPREEEGWSPTPLQRGGERHASGKVLPTDLGRTVHANQNGVSIHSSVPEIGGLRGRRRSASSGPWTSPGHESGGRKGTEIAGFGRKKGVTTDHRPRNWGG